MKISLTRKSNIPKHKKDGRINPHRFWIVFMLLCLDIVTLEIIAFTYLFIVFSRKLDAPVEARPDTNTSQIQKIEQLIQKTEDAVSTRTGVTQESPGQ